MDVEYCHFIQKVATTYGFYLHGLGHMVPHYVG